jgi:hypothetical protein
MERFTRGDLGRRCFYFSKFLCFFMLVRIDAAIALLNRGTLFLFFITVKLSAVKNVDYNPQRGSERSISNVVFVLPFLMAGIFVFIRQLITHSPILIVLVTSEDDKPVPSFKTTSYIPTVS